jgi:predicted nuclease with TOPRIM domain
VAVIEELQKRLELAKVEKSKLEVSNGKKDDDLKATLIKIEELEQDIEQLQRKLNEPSQENQSSPSISQQATFSVASSASFISVNAPFESISVEKNFF